MDKVTWRLGHGRRTHNRTCYLSLTVDPTRYRLPEVAYRTLTYIKETRRSIFSHIGMSGLISRDLHLARLSSYTHRMATQLEKPLHL